MNALLATLAALASLFLAAPAALACADENGCRNRPEAAADAAAKPQTRALKKKPKKECQGSLACEHSTTATAETQTRALKKKPKKECADENTCR